MTRPTKPVRGPFKSRVTTLRARIVWSTAAITTLAMAGTIAGVAFAITNLSSSRIEDALRSRIDTAASALTVGPNGAPQLAADQQDDADDAVWLYTSDGTPVSGPNGRNNTAEQAATLAKVARQTSVTHGDRRYMARPVRVAGHPDVTGTIVAVEFLRPYQDTRNVAIYALLALGAVVIAGTATITSWTVGRTLKPIHKMTAQAAEWSERDLDTRFALGPSADEFTALGNTLDALLDRVASALRQEQRLTAELAHELRTPLTAIRGEAELGQLTDPNDARYQRIIDLVDRLSSTITTLLAIARDQAGTTRRADLHTVIADVLESLPPTDITIDADVPAGSATVAASPELVERALAPLVDNAIRHARAQVKITAELSSTDIRVRIEDDGSGVPAEVRDNLFDAGISAPNDDGAGLGLALSRRVANAAGGDTTLTSASNPTVFELRLPRR